MHVAFLQVASTDSITVGQWIRIYAPNKFGGVPAAGRRRNLLTSAHSTANNSSAVKHTTGYLPMPEAVQAGRALADRMFYYETAPAESVTAAAVTGSLDSYLYGNLVGADSGSSECLLAACELTCIDY